MKSKVYSLVFLLLLIYQSMLAWAGSPSTSLPEDFVDIQEVIPSIVLDMRYYSSHNFVGERIDGYHAPRCILTKEAAEALKKAQNELKNFSLSLKVYDCYRPQRSVDHFVRWAKDISDTRMKKEFYPAVDKKDLLRKVYIAAKSSHSRGSSIDVTIVPLPVPEQEQYVPDQDLYECYLPVEKRFKDNSIDMGTGFDCFHEVSHTANNRIGAQQRANRLLFKAIMEKYGFVNYEKEWWHFTLKNEPFLKNYFDFVIERCAGFSGSSGNDAGRL